MATSTYGTPYVQGSDLVSAYPTVSSSLATRVDEVSYRGNGLNAQTGTTYTLVVGDAGKTITLSNASPVAVTLPQDSTADLPDGAVVTFYNLGAGTVTISQGAGATLQGGSIILPQFANVTIIKLSANTYGRVDGLGQPGRVLVAVASFSAASTVSINGCFTSAYDNYSIIFRGNASIDQSILARLRLSGTDASGANYTRQYILADNTSVAAARTTALTSYALSPVSTAIGGFSADIYGPAIAAQTVFTNTAARGDTVAQIETGIHSLATAYDGITFIGGGVATLTGTIRVYGYRNSL